MTRKEFIEELKKRLEIQGKEITEETDLQSLEEFDSLGIMSVISLIDEVFGKTFTADQFAGIVKVKDLIHLIGESEFE
jgi:acyl carrier protein